MAHVEWNMLDGLYKDIKKFKSRMLDFDYERFKNTDYCEWCLLFLVDIVNKPKLMKFYKNKLLDLGFEEKKINDLFYFIMKCDMKFETKQFSWFEMEELGIEFDPKIKTTNWTIL